jgi:phosphoribosylformylglycinamidine cyclo-ligase
MSLPPSPHPTAAYEAAGVSLSKANQVVALAAAAAKRTHRPDLGLLGIGGFSGAFKLPTGYRNPVLLAACDGVGTKLELARELNEWHSVGVDLVAMSVNDLLCQGAEPLVFLDYIASGSLDMEAIAQVLAGIADACTEAGCSLVGGETAEMPGMYAQGKLDLAGFALGVAEEDALLPRPQAMQAGDAVLALTSSGVHSNGFSLIRHALAQGNLSLTSTLDDGRTLAIALMTPTQLYVQPVLALLKAHPVGVLGLAHITGGGLYDNINRMLPDHLQAVLQADAWPVSPLYAHLHQQGGWDWPTLWQTFNAGLGLALVVSQAEVAGVQSWWAQQPFANKLPLLQVGNLQARPSASAPHVVIEGLPTL